MTYVFIKVYGGLVDDVAFFEDAHVAMKELADFVRDMNPQDDDGWVFSLEGMIANAKTFLDENDEFIEGVDIIIPEQTEPLLYVIVNPHHPMGFMVTSPDDTLAFKNPVEALSELGFMRKSFGKHLRLFRLVPTTGLMATKKDLKSFHAELDIDDFDYSQVEEYLSTEN